MSGLSGHMMHPCDDLDLSTRDLIKLAEKSLAGKLSMTEKIDGFGLHLMKVSDQNSIDAWRVVRCRRDLEEGGIKYSDLSTRFFHNKKAEKFYKESVKIMSRLSEELFKKFKTYQDSHYTYNAECLFRDGVTNTLYYKDAAPLYIHNIWKWTDNDVDVIDLGFTIDEPDIKSDPKITYIQNLKDKNVFKSLKKYVEGFDTIGDMYHQILSIHMNYYIGKRLNVGFIPHEIIDNVFCRMFHYGEKINLKELRPKLQAYYEDDQRFIDDMPKIKKQVIEQLDRLILEIGQIIIKNCHGYINENKVPFYSFMEKYDVLNDLQSKNNVIRDETTRHALLKYNSINPLEGVVVEYKGKKYKWTGSFAPYNKYMGQKYRND